MINPASGAGTDYQVKIIVHYGSGVDYNDNTKSPPEGHVYVGGKCRTDFGDIRFTAADGETPLFYWMEEKVDGDYAVFWVRVEDDLSVNPVTIYVYYGNPSATTISDGKATFVLFDDFNDGVLDSMWTEYDFWGSGVTVTEENGYVEIVSNGTYSAGEIRVLLPSSMSNLAVDVKFMEPVRDNIEGFNVVLQDPSRYLYWDYYDKYDRYRIIDGTTQIAYKSAQMPTTTFWKSYFLLSGTRVQLIIPDGSIDISGTISASKNVESVALNISAKNVANMTARFDDFRVRKYVYPEPSHGAWGPEETAPF